jgi:ABC-type glycerol-3-phosphate transport system permease component
VNIAVTTTFMLLIAGYFLLPVFWLVIASTKTQGDLVDSFGLWFAEFNLGENLSQLFSKQDGAYVRWLLNSLLYAGVGAAIGTLLSAMAGYALAKYRFRGRELIFSIVLGGVLVPATALALPLFLLFAKADMTNTYWSVFLPSIVSPFGVYLSRIFAAASVPDELLEAARLDGAGEFRTFFTIAVRLMSPALVTIFLFQFIVIWNNFFLPLIMLQSDRLYPITLGLFTWQSQVSRDPVAPDPHRGRVAGVGHPDHHHLPGTPALLAVRSLGGRSQVVTQSSTDRLLERLGGLAYGGDYNPEQWPEQTWADDVRRMREAGVNLVTVGVFSWALLEPADGTYEFGWLDRVLDLLHENGIAVDLATATASPPPWFSTAHPETLPVAPDGTRLWPGGRQAWCPSSPVFRAKAVALVDQLAKRYAEHPALVLWHVSNELGCHNAHCYCDVSAAAFRGWLQRRYGTLDALNDAWGTAFWSQRYYEWEHILPPRDRPAGYNPTHVLDFARFSSDELLDHYRAERDALRATTPDVPVTTNLMVQAHIRALDYWSGLRSSTVVANDHYLDHRLVSAEPHVELAFAADLTRGIAGGQPWLLMETSTSAVNWQPHNVAKAPGSCGRNRVPARGSAGPTER